MDDYLEFSAIPQYDQDEVGYLIREMGIQVEHDNDVDYDMWID